MTVDDAAERTFCFKVQGLQDCKTANKELEEKASSR